MTYCLSLKVVHPERNTDQKQLHSDRKIKVKTMKWVTSNEEAKKEGVNRFGEEITTEDQIGV